MNKEQYSLMVTTDCWKIRRNEYAKRHDRCEICTSGRSLQVHHLSYERLGHERDEDLVVVCELCHRAIHGMVGTSDWRKTMLATEKAFVQDQKKRLIISVLEALP
jgi:hypothetical protein